MTLAHFVSSFCFYLAHYATFLIHPLLRNITILIGVAHKSSLTCIMKVMSITCFDLPGRKILEQCARQHFTPPSSKHHPSIHPAVHYLLVILYVVGNLEQIPVAFRQEECTPSTGLQSIAGLIKNTNRGNISWKLIPLVLFFKLVACIPSCVEDVLDSCDG